MKLYCCLFLFTASLASFAAQPDYKIVKPAPPGIIHLRNFHGEQSTDHYVNARYITSVRVYDSGTEDKPQATMRIYTIQTKYASYDNEEAGSESVSYRIIYSSRSAADAAAKKIIAAIGQAEQTTGKRE